MRASLFVAGSHFSEDFDREVTRVFLFFHPDPEARPAASSTASSVSTIAGWPRRPYPRLVRDVFSHPAPVLMKDSARATGLEVLRPAEHRFVILPLAA